MDGYASRFQHVLLVYRAAFLCSEVGTGGQVSIIRLMVCHALCMKISSWWKFGLKAASSSLHTVQADSFPATPLWTLVNYEHLDIVHLYLKFLYTEHPFSMMVFGCNCSRQ